MSVRNLDILFRPKSVALIGASDRPRSVGATVMRNLLEGGFAGPILPVNPKYEAVAGVLAYPDVASLPTRPDLAVICTPPRTVPSLIAALGRRGTKAAVVLTAGLAAATEPDGRSLQQAMLEAARPHLLRILGPNCVGLLVPGCGLNASFAHTAALPGKVAFISQSGALTTALLDWARSRWIGFSHFISLGDGVDVDFGDVLDYLGSDPATRAILMYMESVRAARKFLSAARAAARNKPVLVVKAGRAPEGARAAASHTGALAGSDQVFDAAVRRAGLLRVETLSDLFDAAETLARTRPFEGDRLTIMTNGGGAAVLAADTLALGRGRLATLSAETIGRLDDLLPPTWSHANPVDIIGDAPVERYVRTLQVLLDDPGTDAVLFMHAPTAVVPSEEIAVACAPLAQQARHPVLGCWLGVQAVQQARRRFEDAGLPTYDTPEEAVGGFLQMVNYRRNQDMLMESPPSAPEAFTPDLATARRVVAGALAAGRAMLSEPEARTLLDAYRIPVVETRVVAGAEEAGCAAGELGFPVVLKILSPDISHKSDVGGVALNLESAQEVRAAADAMLRRVRRLRPDAAVAGFTVQAMMSRPRAHELIVGAATDAIFGPVILFGQGGTAVEVIGDRAVALPPLNMSLARDLVSGTRVSRLLAGYRDRVPVDHDALYLSLLKVSQLVCDLPEVVELDINPLLADDRGVIALDARVRVAPAATVGAERLAIRPYPKELEERADFQGRSLLLRPIRPEDEPLLRALITGAEAHDLHVRCFRQKCDLPHSQLARLSQIDYDREMTLVAVAEDGSGAPQILGDVRALADPDNLRAEFAIMVRPDLKGKGLGRRLLEKMIRYLRDRGTGALVGECLPDNRAMVALAHGLGFKVDPIDDGRTLMLTLELQRG